MRTLTEFNRGRVGMMGAVVTVLVVGVAQSFTSVPMLFATLPTMRNSPTRVASTRAIRWKSLG